ncbi:MAG: hypothetical protein KAI47_02880 [Deltaproteobacteria bacterium]|nr:hypothetical protein [Deltaproteobacteria bacterium]
MQRRVLIVLSLTLCLPPPLGCTRWGFEPSSVGDSDRRETGLDLRPSKDLSDGPRDLRLGDAFLDGPRDQSTDETSHDLRPPEASISPDTGIPFGQRWSHQSGAASNDLGYGVAVDNKGTIFVTGRFQGTANFGGGPLVSAGDFDIFIASYTAAGAYRWAKRFGKTTEDLGFDIALGPQGNLFIIGEFRGTLNLGGKDLVSAGQRDVLVASYTPSGVHRWSKRFGEGGEAAGRALIVDKSGNLFITGHNQATINFGGGILTSAEGHDGYLASFTSAGTYRWSKRFGAADYDLGRELVIDSHGNLILVGTFNSTINVGGGDLSSAGGGDILLAKFTSAGAHVWSKRFGGSGDEYGRAVAIDDQDRLTIAGRFANTIDFGGGPLTSAGDHDIFVAGLTAQGKYRWAKRFGSPAFDYAEALTATPHGDIFLAGLFRGTVDFGQGPVTSAGDADIFVVSTTSSGTLRWTQHYGDTALDEAKALALGPGGALVATGQFSGTIDFGDGPLTSAGGTDIFLLRIKQ